jgi:hypothetical protein
MNTTKTISMLDGNTFAASNLAGNIAASSTDTAGLFAWDTHDLSRRALAVNGLTPNQPSASAFGYARLPGAA